MISIFFHIRKFLFAAAAAVVIVLLGLLAIGLPFSQTLDSKQIYSFGADSNAYVVDVPYIYYDLFRSVGNKPSRPERSELMLYENNAPLGPVHSLQSDVMLEGGGAFSHWRTRLIFSASDNSDPRVNGRVYHYETRLYPRVRLLLAGGVLALGLTLLAVLPSFLPFLLPLWRWARRCYDPHWKILLPLGLSLGVLLGIFLAGELYYRLTTPFTQSRTSEYFDPVIGRFYEPGSEVRFTNHLDFWVRERVNSLGFVDREPNIEAFKNSCHITFIGDSFVDALQVPVAQKSHVLLEERLRESRPGWNVTTSAFGISGTGQLNQLPYFDVHARNYSPELIVLVFVNNDFANNSILLESLYYGWNPDHLPALFAVRNAEGDFEFQEIDPDWSSFSVPTAWAVARTNSPFLFWNWILDKIGIYFNPGAVSPIDGLLRNAETLAEDPRFAPYFADWRPESFHGLRSHFGEEKLPLAFEEALALTGFALDEFKRRAQEIDASLVILSSHGMWDHPRMVERLNKMAAEREIPVIDQGLFIQEKGRNLSDANFPNDGHWNQQGHIWAAEALEAFLLENPHLACRK